MNDHAFAPQIASIPDQVRQGVAQALGVPTPTFSRLHGGTTDRTFRVADAERQWVLRVETLPATQLPRAVAAQRLAQSARVAVPDIVAFELPHAGSGYCWSLEHFLAGTAFDHSGFQNQATRDAAHDLGRQLRSLHTLEIDGLGLIPREEVYPHRVERALDVIHAPAADRLVIERAYSFIKASRPSAARLCKNDCAGTNILVQHGKVAGIIDWEWAWGGDPAWDIAYWQLHNNQPRALDYLIAGYQPDDPAALRRRVTAQQVACAIELISVFSENVQIFDQAARNAGVRLQQTRLAALIRRPEWEL
ncbi:MAG: aminoglycoside phosphotransferase family protein [Roseiflexaceae bacterium]